MPLIGPRVLSVLLLLAIDGAFLGPSARADTVWLRRSGEGITQLGPIPGTVDVETPPSRFGGVTRADLERLRTLEGLIAEAREAASELDEPRALRLLVDARRQGEANAAIPGATRYLAEIETQLGLVAALAGLDDLAEEALGRAVTLDPNRALRMGEAEPALVARSRTLTARSATAPRGRFIVRAPGSPGARVFLDGRLLGDAPREVEATVGRHLLRVEAPGRRDWGRVLDVLEGERTPLEVRLSPSGRERRRRALLGAASPATAASALSPRDVLFWVIVDENGRSVLTLCTSRGCTEPEQRERPPPPGAFEPPTRDLELLPVLPRSASAGAWTRAIQWLNASAARRSVGSKWKRWVGIAAGVAALGIAASVAGGLAAGSEGVTREAWQVTIVGD